MAFKNGFSLLGVVLVVVTHFVLAGGTLEEMRGVLALGVSPITTSPHCNYTAIAYW